MTTGEQEASIANAYRRRPDLSPDLSAARAAKMDFARQERLRAACDARALAKAGASIAGGFKVRESETLTRAIAEAKASAARSAALDLRAEAEKARAYRDRIAKAPAIEPAIPKPYFPALAKPFRPGFLDRFSRPSSPAVTRPSTAADPFSTVVVDAGAGRPITPIIGA